MRAVGQTSLDEYVRGRQIDLAKTLETKKAVYLDINFWIILRDIQLGIRSGTAETAFILGLRAAVRAGAVFCPISDTTFGELLKNAHRDSRMAVARLIDEFSLGVTLLPFDMRVGTELAHLLHSACTPLDVHPLRHLVWSKLAYVMGFVHPTKTIFDAERELLMQKDFFDHMWSIPMEGIIDTLDNSRLPDLKMFAELATRLNALNDQHANELKGFERTYSDEVHGVIDMFLELAIDIVDQMVEVEFGPGHKLDTGRRQEQGRQIHNLLFAAFAKRETKMALPTMNVLATIHAAVRWNRRQRLKANDFLDFQHATAALGYCDAFLTERSLASLITAAHTRLDQMYECKVMSSLEAAVEYLATLERGGGLPLIPPDVQKE